MILHFHKFDLKMNSRMQLRSCSEGLKETRLGVAGKNCSELQMDFFSQFEEVFYLKPGGEGDGPCLYIPAPPSAALEPDGARAKPALRG